MTRRIEGTLIIENEEPRQCDDCGEIRGLRRMGRVDHLYAPVALTRTPRVRYDAFSG